MWKVSLFATSRALLHTRRYVIIAYQTDVKVRKESNQVEWFQQNSISFQDDFIEKNYDKVSSFVQKMVMKITDLGLETEAFVLSNKIKTFRSTSQNLISELSNLMKKINKTVTDNVFFLKFFYLYIFLHDRSRYETSG